MIDLTWREISAVLAALWLAGVSWFAKHMFGEMQEKSSRAELKAVLERVDRHHDEARESREKLYNRINDIAESVAYLRGVGEKEP